MGERRIGGTADERGLNLAAKPESVVDVYFDEHRVFSAAPSRVRMRDGRAHLAWPKVLQQHIGGCTQLVVKEHLTGIVLLDEPVQFGRSTTRISVTDRDGRPLAVDKFGALVRMFTETDEAAAHHLASEVARLAVDVNAFGVVGYVIYGSLLGAVRNGKLIGHDTDTDMAYLSNHTHPADIARESFALERFLVDRGWTMQRIRVGLTRAVLHDQSGDLRHIDIFFSSHDGTHFYLNPYVFAELPQSALVPTSTVLLEGVKIPAPADPEAVLTATYGPSYLIPDPSFEYDTSRLLQRKSHALVGNYRLRRALWQRRLRKSRRNHERAGVADFAKWVDTQGTRDTTIVDVGCGTGGDALWFARQGHRVIGIDYGDPPIGYLRKIAEQEDLDAQFLQVSLYDVRATLALGARLAGEPDDDLVLYSRHLLDVLGLEGRTNFWLLARTALLRGGKLYLRFRTAALKDAMREPGFRALDPDVIEAEATARGARTVSRKDRRGETTMVLTWQAKGTPRQRDTTSEAHHG